MRFWLALLVATGATAHADDRREEGRAMTMAVGLTGVAQTDAELDTQAKSGPVLTLGWEDPPIDYPDQRGNHYGGSLVPELVGGVLLGDRRAEGMVGAGLRAELKFAQREGGLLRITCRGAGYLAVRGIVIGEKRDPLVEGVLGEYIQLQSGFRFGFDVGVAARWGQTMEVGDRAGVIGQLYFGWGKGGSPLR